MNKEILEKLVDTHVAAWNERDRTKRDLLLEKIYAENIKMYDSDSIFESRDAISQFITAWTCS